MSVEPSFIVGVTGPMDLSARQSAQLTAALELVFDFLQRGGANSMRGEELAAELARRLVPDVRSRWNRRARSRYRKALRGFPAIQSGSEAVATARSSHCDKKNEVGVPIVVLTNLAPGTDALVSDLALRRNLVVRAALPFPKDLYRRASTFAGRSQEEKEAFDRRCEQADNVFHVRLENEAWLHESAVADRAKDDLTAPTTDEDRCLYKTRADLRYSAASEYLSVHAHLLIAVCKGEKSQDSPGATKALETRIYGTRPHVLPTSHGLRLTHGGPALEIWFDEDDARDPARSEQPGNEITQGSDVDRAAGLRFRLLHPAYLADPKLVVDGSSTRLMASWQSGLAHEGFDDNPKRREGALKFQEERIGVFRRAADHLRSFKQTADAAEELNLDPPEPWRVERRQNPLLDVAEGDDDWQAKEVVCKTALEGVQYADDDPGEPGDGPGKKHFSKWFEPLARAQARAESIAGREQTKVKRTVFCLFVATFVAAGFFHVFAHSGAAASKPVKIIFGGGALTIAAGALCFFGWRHSKRHAEVFHDLRAVGEGLRVQFAWCLAGLGRSVPANYLQRQRNELDWIRSAIRSITAPYDVWRTRFLRLYREDQYALLQVVRRTWVDGQRAYFERRSKEHQLALHTQHTLGAVAAVTGVLLSLACVGQSCDLPCLPWVCGNWLECLGAAAGTWLVCFVARWKVDGHPGPTPLILRNKKRNGQASHPPWFVRFFAHPVSWAVPAPHELQIEEIHDTPRRRLRLVWGFVTLLPLATIVTVAFTKGAMGVSGWSGFPDEKYCTLIVAGWALLAGALLVAYAEKRLYSETAYQYRTMFSLFRTASQRLRDDLTELHDRLVATKTGTGYPAHDDIDAWRAFDQHRDDIQEYLYALGKEALDENADWLLLHRARPLEPVMAG